jgi:hypothetical protein
MQNEENFFDNSPWECEVTDKDHCSRIYPQVPITRDQKIQWDLFNKLPLSIKQRQQLISRLMQCPKQQEEQEQKGFNNCEEKPASINDDVSMSDD